MTGRTRGRWASARGGASGRPTATRTSSLGERRHDVVVDQLELLRDGRHVDVLLGERLDDRRVGDTEDHVVHAGGLDLFDLRDALLGTSRDGELVRDLRRRELVSL